MKPAVIFAGGCMDSDDFFRSLKREDWLVVCADSGYHHALRLGIVPDMIIGDCDSTDIPYPKEIPCRIYPPQKDKTDTGLCLDWAISKGCSEVLILGGLGGRLDHEFCNFNLLLYGLNRGVTVRLINGQNEIFMRNKPFTLTPGDKKYVSFFPYGGEVKGFTIKGLKYEIASADLSCDTDLTVSNEFLPGKKGEISFQSGNVLVILSQDI